MLGSATILSICKWTTFTSGPPPLGEKGSYDFTTVSMSVGKRFFSKMAHIFWKKSHFGDNAQKHPKNRVFLILQENAVHWCVDFLGLNHAQ